MRKGQLATEEAKENMRRAARKRVLKYRNRWWVGRKHSAETIKVISDKTRERLLRFGHPMKGKKLPESFRRKLRKAWKKRIVNFKSPMLGKKHTAESRKNMSLKLIRNKFSERIPKTLDREGYVYIIENPTDLSRPLRRVREHRLIVESCIGRKLYREEDVHHINGVRHDNRIENLILFSSTSAHHRFHSKIKKVEDKEIIFDGRKYEKG